MEGGDGSRVTMVNGCRKNMNAQTEQEQHSHTATAPLLLSLLPADTLSCIHAFLPAADLLCGLLASSRALHDIILDDAHLWQGMCQRRFGVPPPVEGVDSAAAAGADDEGPDAWFRDSSDKSASASASSSNGPAGSSAVASSSSSSTSTRSLLSASSNRWLILYRSLSLTTPRWLQLQVLYVDDAGRVDDGFADSIDKILDPLGVESAYCSNRNNNIHAIFALAPSVEQKQPSAATAAATATAQPHATVGATSSLVLASQPLPPSFLLSDFEIAAPSEFTAPLSSGLLFFSATLPTPAQISAWDDWSEAQWKEREQRIRVDGAASVDKEEVARGEGEPDDLEEQTDNRQEPHVMDWEADGPAAMRSSARASTLAADAIPRAFPLRFDAAPGASPGVSPSPSSFAGSPHGGFDEGDNSTPQPVLAPQVAFFHLETNGTIVLNSAPVPLPTVATPSNESSSSSVGTSSSSGTATAAASVLGYPLIQFPYKYRHHFARPVHGRFLVLTFLRSSGTKENIDVSYFGVKGFRKGMTAAPPRPASSSMSVRGTPISWTTLDLQQQQAEAAVYREQLLRLAIMGFSEASIGLQLEALRQTDGDVDDAMDAMEKLLPDE